MPSVAPFLMQRFFKITHTHIPWGHINRRKRVKFFKKFPFYFFFRSFGFVFLFLFHMIRALTSFSTPSIWFHFTICLGSFNQKVVIQFHQQKDKNMRREKKHTFHLLRWKQTNMGNFARNVTLRFGLKFVWVHFLSGLNKIWKILFAAWFNNSNLLIFVTCSNRLLYNIHKK